MVSLPFCLNRSNIPLNIHLSAGGFKGRWMPRVKKLFQECENSVKPEYIHEYMFDYFGILADCERNWAGIPLSIRFHDGIQAAREWKDAAVFGSSHVIQMAEEIIGIHGLLNDANFLFSRI